MENIDLSYLAKTIAALSGVPTRIYRGEEEIFHASVVVLPKDPITLFWKELWAIDAHIGYFITPRFYLYGVVRSGDLRLIVGPTAQIAMSNQTLNELAFLLDVQKEEKALFIRNMKSIISMPLESLLMMLCPINYIVNGEKLEIKDILISDGEQESIKKGVEARRTQSTYEAEPQAQHNTLALEEALMNIVRKGDTAALSQWAERAPSVRGGVLADDQLRQLRNTLIVTATLTSRAAIRGGMDADDAFSLSDAYIRRCEALTSQRQLVNLQYNMVAEFTEQVEKIHLGRTPSKLQTEVANYIRHHLSEHISTEEMAKALFLSRSRLSTRFKREAGITLTDYILTEKTEEAKRLLRYSDKSVSAIGDYLGFSSHGHFSGVFKKYAGMTPREYREKYS